MAKEPDNLMLSILREMRVDMKEVRKDMSRLDETLNDVRRHVVSLDLRGEALDGKFEIFREGTISAIGYAANASRAHVDLHKQITDLKRRVEKLEQAK
jgi:predicted nuclease with TOPRIM domain